MGLIEITLIIAILGFCAWLLLTYIPMPPLVRQLLIAVMVIFIILFILQQLGFVTGHRVRL